jgi:hemerythrin-like domain-containing protein
MNSFNDLLDVHRELDELFFRHQRALMRIEIDHAEELLRQYERDFLAQLRDEDEEMLTMYEERVDPQAGADVDIFRTEHDKLRQLLGVFAAEVGKIRRMDDQERGVLLLIDSQNVFKRLLIHHDTRKKKMLYPLLDEVTTEAEREELFARLKRRERR